MSARIWVNLDAVRPVTPDNQWHRMRLQEMPKPGATIRFLCGGKATVEYAEPNPQITLTTCWDCDLVYRRQKGLPVPPDHPGLTNPAPQPRRKP